MCMGMQLQRIVLCTMLSMHVSTMCTCIDTNKVVVKTVCTIAITVNISAIIVQCIIFERSHYLLLRNVNFLRMWYTTK